MLEGVHYVPPGTEMAPTRPTTIDGVLHSSLQGTGS